MIPPAIDAIRTKRNGLPLSPDQIEAFVEAAAHGGWPDYQLSAMLMAIWIRGLSPNETAVLTRKMADSGKRYDWRQIPGPKIDKHSTGGVGDKTSLIVAPLAAACGVIVPMMSGRGLGHTGGTVDKLESIPGFRIDLSAAELERALSNIGFGLIGQSSAVAPADKKLYALRDVTATVESSPLITASILSKKLAEGIDGLVLDVKFGRGAFCEAYADAKALAQMLVDVGKANGLRVEALLTDMDNPLGDMVGNALEVIESIEILKGRGSEVLAELSIQLAARMLLMSGLVKEPGEAVRRIEAARANGQGLEKFRQIVAYQGGDPRIIDDYSRLPSAPKRTMLLAPKSGFIHSIHAWNIGRATMLLGAGRVKAEDRVDHAVGVRILKHVGNEIRAGEPWLEVHHQPGTIPELAQQLFEEALEIGDDRPDSKPLIREIIT